MIEVALYKTGHDWDRVRVDYALRQHEQWYKGDGIYGDGPEFHWDYYNSLVIQPFMLDILDAVKGENAVWDRFREQLIPRAVRYGVILERMISPEGTYPPIGRSLAYRFGVFHHLANLVLHRMLPSQLQPGQVRAALEAVISRGIEAPGTFDDHGWLTIGMIGKQPPIGEGYINSGSVYAATLVFIVLGLPQRAPFWSAPEQPWTSSQIWSGEDVQTDHALHG